MTTVFTAHYFIFYLFAKNNFNGAIPEGRGFVVYLCARQGKQAGAGVTCQFGSCRASAEKLFKA